MATIDLALFAGDEIQKALEGEMVTVCRVSRDTIVKALNSQTSAISALFKVWLMCHSRLPYTSGRTQVR